MAPKALLDVPKSDWLPKLVEPRPSKNFGSNELWDIGLLWEPVLYWYVRVRVEYSHKNKFAKRFPFPKLWKCIFWYLFLTILSLKSL